MGNNSKVVQRRLRLKRREEGAPTIDRLVSFVVGAADPTTLQSLRGAVFRVGNEW